MHTGNRWWVVFASLMGLLGSGSIQVFVFSVFIGPLAASFGWSRGAISVGLLLSSFAGALASPFVGWLVDRRGTRAVVLPAIIAFALLTASFALLSDSLPVYYALSFVLGIAGGLQSPLPYSKLVSALFDRRRGLALGVAITGTGIGAAVMPLLAARLTAQYGWRVAFVGLGIAIFLLAFPATALLLPNFSKQDARAAAPPETGSTLARALRTRQFWQLAAGVFLLVAAANGTVSHAVALLGDQNVPRNAAVIALTGVGIVTVVSRLLAGLALDRFNGPLVAGTFVSVSGFGMLLLAIGASPAASVLGVVLCGVVIGAEIDMVGFLVSRYFGLSSFGRIYGLLFALIPIGVGVGTGLMGASFDRAHTYSPMLIAFTVALFVSAGLFFGLGPYAYAARRANAAEV